MLNLADIIEDIIETEAEDIHKDRNLKNNEEGLLPHIFEDMLKNERTQTKSHFGVSLKYNEMNDETNALFLAFSKLIKTIRLAKNSNAKTDDNQTLINYHEIFKSFK